MSIALVDRAALYGTGWSDQHVSVALDKLDEVIAAVNVINVGEGVVLVADLTAAKALTAVSGALDDKRLILIESLGLYRCDSSGATAADDVSVIRPTVWGATNGRLYRIAKLTMVHTHATDVEGGKLAQANTHESADVDSATTALHHTTGNGANQAAPGDHAHLGTAGHGVNLGAVSMTPRTPLALANQPDVLTAAELLANNVFDATAMTTGRTYTTDTAAAIVAAFVGCAIGTEFDFLVYNPTAYTATIAGGDHVTLYGGGSVTAGMCARFKAVFSAVTGTPALKLFRSANDTTAAIIGSAAGQKIVMGHTVIAAGAATVDVNTGLSAVSDCVAILEDTPLLAEIQYLTAAVAGAAGHILVSGWTGTAANNCESKVGVGKASVGTKIKWMALGTP